MQLPAAYPKLPTSAGAQGATFGGNARTGYCCVPRESLPELVLTATMVKLPAEESEKK